MSSLEIQPLFSTDNYVGLDGIAYPAETKSRYFPLADYEGPVGEVDYDYKKTVNVNHYRNHLNWWLQQTSGQQFSETVIGEQIMHYEYLIDQMMAADPSDPESREWIETEFWRIDAENQDTL